MSSPRSLRIGVIADTHGLFDPMIARYFTDVDRIIHAGDIGDPLVIRRLEAIAPVTAVSGNVDDAESLGFPSETIIDLAGRRVAVRHIVYEAGRIRKDARVFLEREEPDICIFGHTHQPRVEQFGRTLLMNPGSAGPKRFQLPRGLGILTLTSARVFPGLIRLEDRVQGLKPRS